MRIDASAAGDMSGAWIGFPVAGIRLSGCGRFNPVAENGTSGGFRRCEREASLIPFQSPGGARADGCVPAYELMIGMG